jgi:hypothetical protein
MVSRYDNDSEGDSCDLLHGITSVLAWRDWGKPAQYAPLYKPSTGSIIREKEPPMYSNESQKISRILKILLGGVTYDVKTCPARWGDELRKFTWILCSYCGIFFE